MNEKKKFKDKATGLFIVLGVFVTGAFWVLISQASNYWYRFIKANERFNPVDRTIKSEDDICKYPRSTEAIQSSLMTDRAIISENKCIHIVPINTKLEDGSIGNYAVAFLDDKILVAVDPDSIRLWDKTTEKEKSEELFSHSTWKDCVYNFDGDTQNYLFLKLSEINGQKIELMPRLEPSNNQSKTLSKNCPSTTKNDDDIEHLSKKVTSISFSSNNKNFATGLNDGRIAFWNVKIQNPTYEKPFESLTFKQTSTPITALAFNYDGRLLASADQDGTIQIWKIKGGQEVQSFCTIQAKDITGATGAIDSVFINTLVFHPSENILAIGTSSFHEGDKKEPPEPQNKTGVISLLRADTCNNNKKVESINRLVDAEDLQKNTISTVLSLDFSPDGRFLVGGGGIYVGSDKGSISYQGIINLWEVNIGKLEKIPSNFSAEHIDWVRSVKFSSDGKVLASGGDDKKVKLWDTRVIYDKNWWEKSIQEIVVPRNDDTAKISLLSTLDHPEWVRSVTFSPGGTTLASMSDDGVIKLWQMDYSP